MTRGGAGWLQTPLFAPAAAWMPPAVRALPSWRDAKRVAIDIETRDDTLTELGPGVRRGAYICGISFAIEDGPAHYLPIQHEGGGNLDRAHVETYLRDQAAHFEGVIVGANLAYDLDFLWQRSIEFTRATRHADVQICESLLDDLQRIYNLDAILKRRGLEGKAEDDLRRYAEAWGLHPKRDLWRFHSGAVGVYAERDARGPLELLRRQEDDIVSQGVDRAWALEQKVLLALLRMTRRGQRVDLDELGAIKVWARAAWTEALAEIHHRTGIQIRSPMNATEIERALHAIGIAVPHTAKKFDETTQRWSGDKPSVTKAWFAEFAMQHPDEPTIKALRVARDFHKLETTYVDGIEKHLVGDLLHATYKSIRTGGDEDEAGDEGQGARYGRTASRHPNAQNQPTRHPIIGKRWRRIFIPRKPGAKWGCFDFASQEPRGVTHYAEGENLKGAREFAERYRSDPSMDAHAMFAEISGLPRKSAKEVFLAICYGQGGAATADKLGLPKGPRTRRDGTTFVGAGPEAQLVLDTMNERVPFVRKLAYMVSDRARARGYVVLYDGRRCHFPRDAQGNYEWIHKALNRLIQGLAGIQTKTALVVLDDAGCEPESTVHDEFNESLIDVVRDAVKIRDLMRDALRLRVPAKVDVEIGNNAADLAELPLPA